MTNAEIVKALAEKLEVKITIADAQEGKCCVEEPPEGSRDVYLCQESSGLEWQHEFRAYAISNEWCLKGGKNGDWIVTIPRTAMAGIRWVEVE